MYKKQSITVSAVVIMRELAGVTEVLHVRKRGTAKFMLPGGKPELNEGAAACAVREISEELGLEISDADLQELGFFTTSAANETHTILHANVFLAPAINNSELAARAEIAEIKWFRINSDDPLIAPLNTEHVFPLLARLAVSKNS